MSSFFAYLRYISTFSTISPFSLLSQPHIFHRAVFLVQVVQVVCIYIQVGPLGHGYAAVTQQAAQGIDIAAVHQKALGKVVAETMRMNFF